VLDVVQHDSVVDQSWQHLVVNVADALCGVLVIPAHKAQTQPIDPVSQHPVAAVVIPLHRPPFRLDVWSGLGDGLPWFSGLDTLPMTGSNATATRPCHHTPNLAVKTNVV
jgi:hypothetical protein